MNANIVNFVKDGKFYYNLGLKYTKTKEFFKASEYFKKAIVLEPLNAYYYFSLAGVMAELDNIEECIEILEKTIYKMKVFPEFYFALGCNYFNVANYNNAKSYFKKYLKIAPKGQFTNEAIIALKFIKTNILQKDDIKNKEIEKIIEVAKEEINKRNFDNAIRLLREVLKIDSLNLIAYNNLSIIYYMIDKLSLAIDVSRRVLKLNPKNSYANVNLALYYKTQNNEDFYKNQLRILKTIKYESREEILNVICVLSNLNEKEYLNSFLNYVLFENTDAILYHFSAISYHNLGQFDKAKDIWEKLRKDEQYLCIFIDCFLYENEKSKNVYPNFPEMSYDVKMFKDYIVKIEALIKNLIKCNYEEFTITWKNNNYISEIINYCLYKLKTKERLSLLDKLAIIEDEKSILILNNYINNCKFNDIIKKECENILRLKNVVGNNLVYFENINKF